MSKQSKYDGSSPNWSTIVIDDGQLKFDQSGLTCMEANRRSITLRNQRLEALTVEPPDDADMFDDGPFAVIQVKDANGENSAKRGFTHCSGLSLEDAKDTAERSLANNGPGKQPVKREETVLANGNTLVKIRRPLVVHAAYVVNLETGESWQVDATKK